MSRLPLLLLVGLAATLPGCSRGFMADGFFDGGDIAMSPEPTADEGALEAGDAAGEPGGDTSDTGAPAEPGLDCQEAPPLTAAEWRDLDDWLFFESIVGMSQRGDITEYWGVDISGRVPVLVTNAEGDPAVNLEVELRDGLDTVLWTARTDVHGRAELYVDLFGDQAHEGELSVMVDPEGQATELANVSPSWQTYSVTAEGAEPAAALDLMLVVDTTGSMADELAYLQCALVSVLDTVEHNLGQDIDVRVSVNFYRDEGDIYEVRSFPFTDDPDVAAQQLSEQSADGGGDVPEALHSALTDAVFEHTWREEADSRLAFLVLDAPPHIGWDGVMTEIFDATTEAAAQGIRFVPLAGSGADQDTQFLLRFLASATGGTYTFLTDHSGVGNAHTEPLVGEYEVEDLHDMMVRIIEESLVHEE